MTPNYSNMPLEQQKIVVSLFIEIDDYKITLADLQYNTANILRVIAKTM